MTFGSKGSLPVGFGRRCRPTMPRSMSDAVLSPPPTGTPGGPKVLLEVFGCQMNKLDAELMVGALRKAGYDFTDQGEQADAVLLVTCSVRDQAEHRVRSHLAREPPPARAAGPPVGGWGAWRSAMASTAPRCRPSLLVLPLASRRSRGCRPSATTGEHTGVDCEAACPERRTWRAPSRARAGGGHARLRQACT